MSSSGRVVKRVLVGRAMRSDRLGETLLPKRIALPVFACDALSSVAYAPGRDLPDPRRWPAGLGATHSWQIGLAVVVVMARRRPRYRQNVHAYPSGGGDYEVATVNLGPKAGLTVASALLVDYVLTVAVSISSGVQNAAAAFAFVRGHEAASRWRSCAADRDEPARRPRVGHGVRDPRRTCSWSRSSGWRSSASSARSPGRCPLAESAGFELRRSRATRRSAGSPWRFLLLRAFSSGCAALTGVEAISNGVPAFQKPKSRNAATTLLLMGAIADHHAHVDGRAGPVDRRQATPRTRATQLLRDGVPVGDGYVQDTVMGQVAEAVFDGFHLGVVVVSVATGLILVLAANTAFNGFPVLGSILARDGYLPRQLHTRGDRLAFSNGILILAGGRGVPHRALRRRGHQAHPALHRRRLRLLHPEPGRHGPALEPGPARSSGDRGPARGMKRSRAINAVGAVDVGHRPLRRAHHEVLHGAGSPSRRWSCSSCS